MMKQSVFAIVAVWALMLHVVPGTAQGYELRQEHDSLYWLSVRNGGSKNGLAATDGGNARSITNHDSWRLPYPVYQFQTGDVDGDGSEDAMVGVVKGTRFYPEKGRRLFIFKQVNGKPRPLWLGSKLGGILEDFRFTDGRIRALESTTDSLYVVADYRWGGFGMSFDRYLVKGTDYQTALKYFSQ